jgi:hypothetical protein
VGQLDDYYDGITEAWSLNRRLFTDYTGPACLIMRSSDSTVDGFEYNVDGNLDTPSILRFCGVGDGMLRCIYGQKSANDMVQLTAMLQPKLVIAGVLQTSGGMPAAVFSNSLMETENNCGIAGAVERGLVSVAEVVTRSFIASLGEGKLDKAFGMDINTESSYFYHWSDDIVKYGIDGRHIYGFQHLSGVSAARLDGVSQGTLNLTADTTDSPISMGGRFGPGSTSIISDFRFHELMQFSDTSLIESVNANQKNYYVTP